jgi:hypothetical protein
VQLKTKGHLSSRAACIGVLSLFGEYLVKWTKSNWLNKFVIIELGHGLAEIDKIKLFLALMKHHNMKTYWAVELIRAPSYNRLTIR